MFTPVNKIQDKSQQKRQQIHLLKMWQRSDIWELYYKSHPWNNEEQLKFGECLLPFRPESFVSHLLSKN